MQTQVEIHRDGAITLPKDFTSRVLSMVSRMDERCGHGVIKCRVSIASSATNASRQPRAFRVGVLADVAGGEYAAHKEAAALPLALRGAVSALSRQLLSHRRRQQLEVKSHRVPATATVQRIVDDHGFLATHDGREVLFHRHSVVDGPFEALRPGAAVSFVEQPGERGARASTVRHHRGPAVPEPTRAPAP